MPANVIELSNLVKTYQIGETQVRALRGVSYKIASGDFLAIMGPSGSGKSSLMNILGCLDRPTSGEYFLDGEEVSTFDRTSWPRSGTRRSASSFRASTCSPGRRPWRTPSCRCSIRAPAPRT
jgi:ABC-type lipoprotein export system ATPase subunit